MDFAFSEEQEAFRQSLRRFLEEKSPLAEVFRLAEGETGYEPALWKQMAGELGLQGLHVPEAYGGQGFSFLELGIAFEEMGRVLLCAPFLASCGLAVPAILAAGSEADRCELLPGIAAGEVVATLALLEPGAGWDPAEVALEARREGGAFVLDGEKHCVLDGQTADLVLVAARRPGSRGREGLSLFAVRGDAPGLAATPLPCLDLTRRQAHLALRGVRARLLGEEGAAAPALERALDLAAIALSAEMVGGAQRCLEMAVEYAKQRRQFGRAIGSFQAIQHKAAEVLLEVESARSAAYWACWTAAEDHPDRPQAAHTAKAFCAEAYLRAAAENIQIHGGVGFTWEAAPHLHYRRAKVSELLFGDPVFHRARLAERLGL